MYISGDKQTKAKTTAKAATATRAPVSIDMRQLPANENSRSAIYDNQRRRQPRCQQLQQPMQQQQQQRQQLIGNCCRVWRCSARQFVWSTVAPIDKSGGNSCIAVQFLLFVWVDIRLIGLIFHPKICGSVLQYTQHALDLCHLVK